VVIDATQSVETPPARRPRLSRGGGARTVPAAPAQARGPNSDPTGNTIFVLVEVHESPPGVDEPWRQAIETSQHQPAFMGVERQGQREHAARWKCRVCGELCRRRQSSTTSTSMRVLRSNSYGTVTSCQGQRSQPYTRHQIQTGPKHISREQRKQEILQ
jgi:hypothetical protein